MPDHMLELLAFAAVNPPNIVQILADPALRLYCLMGAVLGGFFAVWLWREAATPTLGTFLVKLPCSIACGLIITPLVFRWRQIDADPDLVFSIAGVASALAIGTIESLKPRYLRVLDRIAQYFDRNLPRGTRSQSPTARKRPGRNRKKK